MNSLNCNCKKYEILFTYMGKEMQVTMLLILNAAWILASDNVDLLYMS
jgi:hypothetical protein